MNREELQSAIRAWTECCTQTNENWSIIQDSIDEWEAANLLCCNAVNLKGGEIIDILSDWAAEYSSTYTDFICQEEDAADINYTIVFENYLCQQVTTTTTTAAATTTTTFNPEQIDWEIVFENYLCQQIFDATATTSTTLDETVAYSGTYTDFICQQEDNPAITTTTTTFSGTTTTSTTVHPEDVEFSATYTDFLCEQTNNPLQTTTTTSTTINEDDVVWTIVFEDYLCQQIFVTTTSTTAGPTTTSTTAVPTTTTTTTLIPATCGNEISGTMEYPVIYEIELGAATGQVVLTFDAIAAPDKYTVEFDGVEVINTGYRGDAGFQNTLYDALIALGESAEVIAGSSSGTASFNKTTASTSVIVKVYAPIEETEWSFTLACPVGLTTTTTTTAGIGYTATYTDFICQQEFTGTSTTTTTAVPTTTTTIAVTTTSTTIPIEEIACGAASITGDTVYPKIYIVTMGAGTGNVQLTYDAKEIPDKFIVEFDGLEVINTGYRGDSTLQTELNAALASFGSSPETIQGIGSGVESFAKNSATTIAIVRVFAPMAETEWSFSLLCPGAVTTTSTTAGPTTTTTTGPVTTTTTAAVTTTTTNAPPVSSNNSETNARFTEGCATPMTLVPAMFTFSDPESNDLEYVKITSYTIAGGGTLTYNGVAVIDNQELQVIGGAGGSFLYSLIYTPDVTDTDAYSDTIVFLVKTENNPQYG